MKIFKDIYGFYKNCLKAALIASGFVAGAGLQSCSDDLDLPFASNLPDGQFLISISIPEAEEIVLTRAEENGTTAENHVSNLAVLFFGSDNVLKAVKYPDFTQTNENISATVTLEGAEKNGVDKAYAVANANSALSGLPLTNGSTNLNEVKEIVVNDALTTTVPNDGFPMTGEVTLNTSSQTITGSLKRIVAKISVSATSGVKGYTLDRFYLYSANKGAYLAAPEGTYYTTTGTQNETRTGLSGYFYPTKAYDKTQFPGGAYVILRAKNANQENSYYRINLRDNATDKNPIDIEANHYYKIEITAIKGDGHASAADAMKNVEGDEEVDYVIHDHAAKVLSMITDGIRELGVTHDFDWDVIAGEETSTTITVKWYSRNSGEENTEPTLELIAGEEWLILNKTGVTVSDNEETSGIHDGDDDNAGKRKKYTLSLKTGGTYTTPARIKVSWMGLTREIVISRDMNADHAALCNVKLNILEGETVKYEDLDYWEFLDASDTFGVSEDAMGKGKARNDGFHFAMPYSETSETSAKWIYKYTIDFEASVYDEGTLITDVSFPDGQDWVICPTIIGDGVKTVSLEYTGGESYDYKIGSVTFTLKDNSGNSHTHTLPVYHTGFFYHHSDGTNVTGGCYYYEVVPVDAVGGEKYMLDRNLGAKSNRMYVEGADGSAIYGNSDAAGGYFTVATKGNHTDEDKLEPTMLKGVCPYGYHVPSKTEWDNVKTAPSFSLAQRTSSSGVKYYTAEMESSNLDVGTIYFPKARFINGSDKAGAASAGYYWSATASEGLEKEQIGNWLKTLNINGTSSSYVNGEVTDYKMSVRCFAGNDKEPDVKHTISFNVRGATHVFLFTKDGNTPVFSFPGKSITGIEGSNKWVYFSYTSTFTTDDLKVLFAKVTNNGAVTLFQKNGYTFEALDSSTGYDVEAAMTDASWDVEKGWYYDFLGEPGEYGDSNPNVTDKVEEEKIVYRIYWSKNYGNAGYLYIEDFGISGFNPYQYSSLETNGSRKESTGSYYYMEFEGDDYSGKNFLAEMKWTDEGKSSKNSYSIDSSFKDYKGGNTTYKIAQFNINGGSPNVFTALSPVLMQSGKQVKIQIRNTFAGNYKYLKIWGGSDEKPEKFNYIGGGSTFIGDTYLNSDNYFIFFQFSTDEVGTSVTTVRHLTLEEGVKDAYGNWDFTLTTSL